VFELASFISAFFQPLNAMRCFSNKRQVDVQIILFLHKKAFVAILGDAEVIT